MCSMLTIAKIARKLKLPWDCEFNKELERLAIEAEEVAKEEMGVSVNGQNQRIPNP